jgi:hypothetical protein
MIENNIYHPNKSEKTEVSCSATQVQTGSDTYCQQQNKPTGFDFPSCLRREHNSRVIGTQNNSGEKTIVSPADTYSPNIPVGVTLQGEDDGSRKASSDNSHSSANNIRTTSPDLSSILTSIQEQVGSSCQYSGRCANHSDKCCDINYRDTCTVKDDFVFGWHGVGL